jgi:apolipoprotein N-acyltransferase
MKMPGSPPFTSKTDPGTVCSEPDTDEKKIPSSQICQSAILSLNIRTSVLWVAAAVACFHLAYFKSWLFFFIVGYLFCVLQLARARSGRIAFYSGLGVGFLVAAPQLGCFWTIFGPAAIVLWLILAVWIGVAIALSRLLLKHFGKAGALMIPVVWTGCEYFRSELYYLRFSWLNTGYTLAETHALPFLHLFGMYGGGFFGMLLVVTCSTLISKRMRVLFGLVLIAAFFCCWTVSFPKTHRDTIRITGVQAEFPAVEEVLDDLDKAVSIHPETDLFMLSEYTFEGPIPDQIIDWCRRNQKFLLAGGKDPTSNQNYYNTAFIVGPSGDLVFKQVKSVPIQFFKDGLPAPSQKLWVSPWGELGVCICYDLSYSRVTDRLVKLGARGLLVPTMDVSDWGEHQHELHARVAEIRAAEYGIPIFRVASSGISQIVNRFGKTQARTSFPGQHEIIHGTLVLQSPGTLPIDRAVAPVCVGLTALALVALTFLDIRRAGRSKSSDKMEPPFGSKGEQPLQNP